MGFVTHLVSLTVAVLALGFTIFVNYPSPPPSPILYQWNATGRDSFPFHGFSIFFKDEWTDNSAINATLLCLHGFPTSSFDWYKLWPDLKKTFSRVIAPDFLGMGFSDKPRHHKYSVFEQADMIEDLLENLNVKSVHLLAHDYGDTVAQELLARTQEGSSHVNFMSVCLMNGGIFPEIHKPIFVAKLLQWPIIGTILCKMSNYYMFRVNMVNIFGPETPPTSAELHDMWSIIRYNEGHRVHGDILSFLDERRQNEQRWVGALKKTESPLNFIYGPADPVNPPPFDEHFRKTIPNGDVDVLDRRIGHYPQLEAPKEMLLFYLQFLQRKATFKSRNITL